MTASKPRRIELEPHEAAHLAAHGRVVIVRVVEPQPRMVWFDVGMQRNGVLAELQFPDGSICSTAAHPYPTGSQWWGAEEIDILSFGGGVAEIAYSSDREHRIVGSSDLPGRPGIVKVNRVPQSASRFPSLTVTEATCKRVGDVTCADAIAAGFPPYANSQTIDCSTKNPLDDFRASLHKLNPTLTPSSWVWLSELETK